ncbi:MAG: VOC family protein [Alphaproteobacteria bacterium]
MTSNAPFSMIGLDHLVIRCVDLDAMTHFYCDLLGCTVDRHNKEADLLQLRAGRHLIDLITVDGVLGLKGGAAPGVEGRNLDHFAIQIDHFDDAALHAYIAEHGIEIVEEGPRYGAEGTGPSVYLKDPEGNIVELKGPPDPA